MSDGSVLAFWFLNHRLEEPELRRQLEEMKAQGFHGVFPHPREGLLTPYLSREWFDRVRFIARECERLGLEFWLYDEDPYPSGVCGGKVTFDHEEFSCRYLSLDEREVSSDGRELIIDLPAGEFLLAFALQRSRKGLRVVADLTDRCGLVRTQWTPARRVTSGYYPPYQNMGREHWRTSAVGAHWRMHAALPPGRYVVTAVFVERGTNPKWGAYPDLMNPKAVEYFIEHTHERYRRELGPKLFATAKGIFTDEAKVTGTFPWTRALPDHYRREYGEALLPLLPHLKYDLGERTSVVRNRYRRLVGKLFRAAFVRPIYDWCRRHGKQSAGHFSPEENPLGQQAMIPDLMELLKDMQLPGVDLISSNIGTADRCIINIGPKLVASVARQTGRKEVLSESLGVSGEDLTLERAKSMLDWQMVMGVNKFVLHGQFYSLDGPRKREAPPSIFWTAPYWPFFRTFSEYIDRTCKALCRGRRICSLAVLYATTHINIALPEAEAALSEWRQRLGGLCFDLLSKGFDFDFVSEQALVEAKHTKTGLKVGRCEYVALLVPEVDVVEQSTADALRRVKVPLIFTVRRPKALESGKSVSGVGCVRKTSRLEAALRPIVSRPLFTAGSAPLLCHSRIIRRNRTHFVFNPTREKVGAELIVETGQWLDAQDEQGETFFPLREGPSRRPLLELPPLGSTLLRESTSPPSGSVGISKVIDLPGPWTLRPQGDNVLILDQWAAKGGRRHRLPHDAEGLRGVKELRSRFLVKSIPSSAALVWEEGTFNGPHELLLNGKRLSGRAARRYDVYNRSADVARLLRKGMNDVTVRFADESQQPMMDPIRLMGHFSLASKQDSCALSAFDNEIELDRLVAWSELGWPFYSGTMTCETIFDAPGRHRVILHIDGLHDLAEVAVNGSVAGVIAWRPYECDISDLLRPGTNRLRLRVANSFVNFIEGEPRPSGIIGRVQLVTGS